MTDPTPTRRPFPPDRDLLGRLAPWQQSVLEALRLGGDPVLLVWAVRAWLGVGIAEARQVQVALEGADVAPAPADLARELSQTLQHLKRLEAQAAVAATQGHDQVVMPTPPVFLRVPPAEDPRAIAEGLLAWQRALVYTLFHRGDRIMAVKVFRDFLSCGLKVARDAVFEVIAESPEPLVDAALVDAYILATSISGRDEAERLRTAAAICDAVVRAHDPPASAPPPTGRPELQLLVDLDEEGI